MQSIDDWLLSERWKAYKAYQARLAQLNDKEYVKKELFKYILLTRLKNYFKNCHINMGMFSDIFIYLTKDYNIEKDWNIFCENNEEFLAMVCGDFIRKDHRTEYTDICYRYNNLTIYLDYSSANCKLVKISETSKVVRTPVYEVQCL